MNSLRQIAAVTWLNLQTLPRRFWPSMVVVVGMVCVVGVLLSMLAMTTGLHNSQLAGGDPGRAIVLSHGAQSEFQSAIPLGSINVIMDAPGVARDVGGAPIVDPEALIPLPANRRRNSLPSTVILRSFGARALELRPEFKLVAGRMFQPGKHEMIAGTGLQGQFKGFAIGDKVIMSDGEWPIVGAFITSHDALEGELVADTKTVMPAARHTTFNSVIVRLTAPSTLDVFKKALTTNRAITVSVERHSDYYIRTSATFASFINAVAYAVAAIMAIGALFGTFNIMYSSVSARTREIATLRALGFGAFPVAVSVMVEGCVLCVAGALIGAAIAWGLYNGEQDAYGANAFYMTVPPGLIGVAILWALAIALLGALLPSIRAARLPLITALQAS